VRDVVSGLRQSLPHQPGGAHGEVEPGVMVHLKPGADAAAGLADHVSDRASELDFRGGVRLVSALVLETLNLNPVARAVRKPAGDHEAGHAGVGLRQSQEHVRVWDGEEPFVPDERPCAVSVRQRPGLGLAQIGAALLFSHRHADRRAGLVGRANLTPVVAGRGDDMTPFGPAGGIPAEDGDGRVGHPDRAADAVLPLVPR
jgi:hypothetical protein